MRTAIEQYIIDQIRVRRLEKGVTQDRLAQELGFGSQGYIGKIESRDYSDSYNINHLNTIAKILGCSPRDFWPEKPI